MAPTASLTPAELRVYLLVEDLQQQCAADLGTPTRARGHPPFVGDRALRSVPTVEPGILYVERQFGVLEVHGHALDDVKRAGQAILDGTGTSASDQLRPRVLYHDIIEEITDQHAVILNRNRSGSMIMPGQALLVYEMTPALFAAVAANEAERVAPGITVVDVQFIGAAGRLYLSGRIEDVTLARDRITKVLESVEEREHP